MRNFFMCWAKYKSYNLFCSYFQKLCMEHFKMVGMISCMFLNRSWSWCELSSAHENFGIWTESYVWLTSGFTVINLIFLNTTEFYRRLSEKENCITIWIACMHWTVPTETTGSHLCVLCSGCVGTITLCLCSEQSTDKKKGKSLGIFAITGFCLSIEICFCLFNFSNLLTTNIKR